MKSKIIDISRATPSCHASKTTIFLALAGLFVLAACDSAETGEADDLAVVEAFLYAGEPIDDIHLSTVIPISSEDSVGMPINDAEVRLLKNGTSYMLTPSGSDGFYHYAGDDLAVETGDVFQLDVDYGGTRITAETTVPAPPTGIAMSQNELVVPDFEDNIFALRDFFQNEDNALSVTWDNPDEELYFVAIRTPGSVNPDYVLPEFVRDVFEGIAFITEPTSANFYDILIFSLEVIGTYEVTVYRINDEYAQLYNNREQDSRDLNEPPTNVEGGLGVFSAFNSQRTSFKVVRE